MGEWRMPSLLPSAIPPNETHSSVYPPFPWTTEEAQSRDVEECQTVRTENYGQDRGAVTCTDPRMPEAGWPWREDEGNGGNGDPISPNYPLQLDRMKSTPPSIPLPRCHE